MQLPVPVTLMTALVSALMSTLATTPTDASDLAPPTAARPVHCQQLSFDEAQARHDAGHYADAYAAFATLADCGHREAARNALQMRQVGPALYGRAFMAGPNQLQRWRRHAAAEPRTDTPQPPPTH
jgi:hypothetical protein